MMSLLFGLVSLVTLRRVLAQPQNPPPAPIVTAATPCLMPPCVDPCSDFHAWYDSVGYKPYCDSHPQTACQNIRECNRNCYARYVNEVTGAEIAECALIFNFGPPPLPSPDQPTAQPTTSPTLAPTTSTTTTSAPIVHTTTTTTQQPVPVLTPAPAPIATTQTQPQQTSSAAPLPEILPTAVPTLITPEPTPHPTHAPEPRFVPIPPLPSTTIIASTTTTTTTTAATTTTTTTSLPPVTVTPQPETSTSATPVLTSPPVPPVASTTTTATTTATTTTAAATAAATSAASTTTTTSAATAVATAEAAATSTTSTVSLSSTAVETTSTAVHSVSPTRPPTTDYPTTGYPSEQPTLAPTNTPTLEPTIATTSPTANPSTPVPTAAPTPLCAAYPREACTSEVYKATERCCVTADPAWGPVTIPRVAAVCEYTDRDAVGYSIGTCCVRNGRPGCHMDSHCCDLARACTNGHCVVPVVAAALAVFNPFDHELAFDEEEYEWEYEHGSGQSDGLYKYAGGAFYKHIGLLISVSLWCTLCFMCVALCAVCVCWMRMKRKRGTVQANDNCNHMNAVDDVEDASDSDLCGVNVANNYNNASAPHQDS